MTAWLRRHWIDLAIALAIVIATFAAYWQVRNFGFVILDDSSYVYNNPHLRLGFSDENLKWIFLSYSPDNWFPLTRLSLVLDYRFFQLNASGYHIENIAFHALAALLLFGFLRSATGARWAAAFAAAMFALHPLHVESVAWIAERKDVLCALFWFASLWAWVWYTRRPDSLRYVLALVLFAFGLTAKPMIVTLPFVLLLLDVWPLRRGISRKLLLEKIPFLLLAVAVMVITIVAQHTVGAMQQNTPGLLRTENGLITVWLYMADTLWPARLWTAHAYPRGWPLWEAILAALAIVAVSAAVFSQIRRRPYLALGWGWFLIALVPVIGLVQVGPQPNADRYMYVPMVGLSIMLAWGVGEAVGDRAWLKTALAVLGVGVCLAMAVRTNAQTQYWRSGEDSYLHAIDMDGQDYLAWSYLGQAAAAQPQLADDAMSYFRNAIRLRPEFGEPRNSLALLLVLTGRRDEGIAEFREAIRIAPGIASAHTELAFTIAQMGQRDEARREYETALQLDDNMGDAHNDLGVMLMESGNAPEGMRHLERAVELKPDDPIAQCNLGIAEMWTSTDVPGAIVHFREALRLDPQLVPAHMALAAAIMPVPTLRDEANSQLETVRKIELEGKRRMRTELLLEHRPAVFQ